MNIHRALGHIFAASGQTKVVAVAPEPSQGAAEHQGLGWEPGAWRHLGISHLGLSLSSALQRGTSHCRLLPWAAAPRAEGPSPVLEATVGQDRLDSSWAGGVQTAKHAWMFWGTPGEKGFHQVDLSCHRFPSAALHISTEQCCFPE